MTHRPGWPLERVLFALAGTVTLLAALLSATVSRWFLVLAGFVGVNQWLYVIAGKCPASIVLRRSCGLRSTIYGVQTPVNDYGLETRPADGAQVLAAEVTAR